MKLPPSPNAGAVVVWLPKDTTPADHSFGASASEGHSLIQPVAYWLLSEAMHAVATDEGHPDEDPWMKIGDQIYDREQIHSLYVAAHEFTDRMQGPDDDGA